MSQQSVYNLLKKKDKWMTAKEISKILKISSGSVTTCLSKLYRHKEILRQQGTKSKFNGFGFVPFQWRIGYIPKSI